MEFDLAARGLDDLVLLDEINEDKVHGALKQRFVSDGQMYTFSGPVLVAMNPYKLLTRNGKSIYDEAVMDAYRGRAYYEMPPSIFSVAEGAYSSLLRYRKPSAVIISGESGAGKTESARQVLAYIARVSGGVLAAQMGAKKAQRGAKAAPATRMDESISTALRVKDRLITSTVVTEAFGNAQTLRNDNSSRFGKLMSINFKSSGIAAGGLVQIYLLEKSRVVHQSEGERGFHVCYQLLAGATPEIRRVTKLVGGPEAYAYLSHEYRKIAGVNDAAQFKALVTCMNILGIPEARQMEMWKMLACVLHLGNLKFTSAGDEDEEEDEEEAGKDAPATAKSRGALNSHAAKIKREGASATALAALSDLLGVKEEEVEDALVHRTLVVNGSETAALQSKEQAEVARDSLAKAVYEKLFRQAVEEINNSIKVTATAAAPAAAAKPASAGAGAGKAAAAGAGGPDAEAKAAEDEAAAAAEAEAATPAPDAPTDDLQMHVLDIFGFETLGTNRFEQLCINFVNEALQGIFLDATLRAEQDEYAAEGIEWTPIEYFDNAVVVQLLDGKGGLFPLLDDACAMADASGEHILQSFTKAHAKHVHFKAPKIHDGTFTVQHYAGPVTYSTEEMGAANRDTLTLDITRLVSHAKGIPALLDAFADKRSAVEKNKRPPTAGLQFRQSVKALVELLSSCQPNYIRCIKPNDAKKPMTVDDERLLHQIRYLGLVEATRVKRAGFAYRATYEEFLRRYRMLSKVTWPPQALGDEQAVRLLLDAVNMWQKPKDSSALGVGLSASAVKGAGAGAKAGAGAGAGRGAGFLGGRRPGPGAAGAGAGAAPKAPAAAPAGGAASSLLGIKPAGAAGGAGGGAPQVWTGNGLPGDFAVAGSRRLVEGTDFQYGATKVFLKEPSTLFNFEYMRILALGRVVSKVAALWRAHVGKRNYKRIKVAWKRQVANVRAHLTRKRFLRMKAASVRMAAAVRGFLVRKSPAATAMREALGMLSFHGKTRRRMSLRWEAPRSGDWLGLIMPGTVGSPSPMAGAVFAALARLSPPQDPRTLAYSDTVLKIKQNYTVLRRALVVTEHYVCNFADPWQKGKINRSIPIASLAGVSMSPFRDGYVVLHVSGQYDYAAMCETKVSLIRALADKYRALTGSELPVTVTPDIAYKAKKSDGPEKTRRITVREVSDLATFASRGLEPWEVKVLAPAAGAGAGGGGASVGGRACLSTSEGGVTYATASEGEAVSTVQKAYLAAEKHRPFHTVAGDKLSLVVSVPVPPKIKLSSLLSDTEREKLKAKGVRGL